MNVRTQLKQNSLAPVTATAPSVVHDVLRSPGQPLDPATRAFMERRFGHNFGNVRVHNDTRAAESARALNAQAFTVGQHISFKESFYSKGLLAHELAHSVQQRYATDGAAEVNGDLALECEAQQAAAQIESGAVAPRLRALPTKSVQMQPDSGTVDREEQLWQEFGIDLLFEELRLKLGDNQFPHPDTIMSGKGMKGQGTQLAGEIYDTADLEFKLHTYSWGWTHSSIRLQMPEKLTHKELAYLYYWYGDETRQIQSAFEKIATTIKDEQRRKELQEVAAYFKATERFVEVAVGGSALAGATGGLIVGSGLGSGIVSAARYGGGYLYTNAPGLAADTALFGGAAVTGAALGEHLKKARTEGVDWEDIPQLAENLLPFAGGVAESASLRPATGTTLSQEPFEEGSPPSAPGSRASGGGAEPAPTEPPATTTAPSAAPAPAAAATIPESLYNFENERVADFEIYGGKGMVGTSFQRRVLILEHIGGPTTNIAPLKEMLAALETEARAAGATELRITGLEIEDPWFFKIPRAWQKFGYSFQKISEKSFEVVKPLGGAPKKE